MVQLKELDVRLSHQPRGAQHYLSDGHIVSEDEAEPGLVHPADPRGRRVELAEQRANGLHQATGAGPGGRPRVDPEEAAERVTRSRVWVSTQQICTRGKIPALKESHRWRLSFPAQEVFFPFAALNRPFGCLSRYLGG